ncbi:MAG: putative solute-binding protein [Pseudomonadota bacterium]
MLKKYCKLIGALSLGAAFLAQPVAAAEEKKTICVFDPVGNSGDVFNIMKDFQAKAMGWGANIKLEAYTDESVIVNELKSGQCDGAVLTGLKARPFNKFSTTIEAVGAIQTYEQMNRVLQTILTMDESKAHQLLRQGPYEVAGVMPAGAVFAFLRDRDWDSLDKIQGKKITVMEGDEVGKSMVRESGGTPVLATTTSFAGKFNNGSVDVTFAPAAAYGPLELYRGLGNEGGIVDMVFIQLTFQMIIRWERFPEEFGTQARRTAFENLDSAFEFVNDATAKIDPKYWVKLNPKDLPGYQSMFRQARIGLRDRGVYDGRMLSLLLKVRCSTDPTRAECSERLE